MPKQPQRSRESRALRTRAHSTSSEDDVGQSSRGNQRPPAARARKDRAGPPRGRTLKRNAPPTAGSEGVGAGPDGGDDGDDDGGGDLADDSDSDAEEPAVMAPSGLAQRKHNRQTGLSISFANAALALPSGGKKRARSPMPEAEEEAAPATKLPRVTGNVANLIDLSDKDDHVYNEVDLISESEDDIDMEMLEEQAMMVSEDDSFPADLHLRSALRSSVGLNDVAGDEEQTLISDIGHFAEHFARTSDTSGIPDFLDEIPRRLSLPGERRVRFADDVPSGDPQTSQGAAGAHADEPHPLDAHGDDPITELEWRVSPPSDEFSDLDEGETTDEDVLLPHSIARPQEKLHNTPIDPTNARNRHTPSAYHPHPHIIGYQGPSMGSWVADPTKPIAVTDKSGTKLIYYPPHNVNEMVAQTGRVRSGTSTPKVERLLACINRGGDDGEDDGSETGSEEEGAHQSFPTVADQMYSDFNKASRDAAIGPQPTLHESSQASSAVQNVDTNDWDESEDEGETGERHLRMEDFIQLDDSDSDDETAVGESDATAPPDASQESGPNRPASSSPERAVDDTQPEWPAIHPPSTRGIVGAKRDRHGARSVSSSSSAMPAKLASKLAGKNLSPGKRVKSKH